MDAELRELQRRVRGMSGLLVLLTCLHALMVIGLSVCSIMLALHVRQQTEEETIAMVRREVLAPLLTELRTVAEATDGPGPELD